MRHLTPCLVAGAVAVSLTAAAQAAIVFNENFDAPLDSGVYTTTTANGGTLAVADGKLTVGPLTGTTEKAYIKRTLTGGTGTGTSGSVKVGFDVTFNTTFVPNASNEYSTDRFFSLFSDGNNPIVGITFGPNDYLNQYEFDLNTGVHYGGGTRTGTGTVNVAISAIEGKTLHVDINTQITDNGSLDWTIQNTAVLTDVATGKAVVSLNYNTTGNASNTAFNPITGPLYFYLGTGTNGSFTNADTAAFSGTMSFDNVNLQAPVPEPASLSLLGLGGLALLRRRRD